MKKQFKNKEELIKWLEKNFPAPECEPFSATFTPPDYKGAPAKLEEEGYNLTNLTANGEGYNIEGHTNGGWVSVCPEDLFRAREYNEDISNLVLKPNIRGILWASNLSQSQFALRYEVPLRSIENWVGEVTKCPKYVLRLLGRAVAEDLKNGKLEWRKKW